VSSPGLRPPTATTPRTWTLTSGKVKTSKGWTKIVVAKGPIPGELERILVVEEESNYTEADNGTD
jgi:hypothetical protein